LDVNVPVTGQRRRHQAFFSFYTLRDNLCYCHNITSLSDAIEVPCNSQDWRLFIDSSSRSLKAVFLHNGNQQPSIPVAYLAQLKEVYNSVKLLLQALNYKHYGWKIIGDCKMVAFLMGLRVVLPSFHAAFVSGTAKTPRNIAIAVIGPTEASLTLALIMSSGKPWWILEKFLCHLCTSNWG